MKDKNVTDEVMQTLLDGMPEPSPVADRIVEESEAELESAGTSPEPEAVQASRARPAVAPVEWISAEHNGEESHENNGAEVPPEPNQNDAQFVDSSGVRFDPNYHAVDSSGNPSRTVKGKWRRKKGAGPPPGPVVDMNVVLSASLAVVTSIELLGCAIGGDEWKPEPNEHEMMVAAWRDYFIATGAVTVPPWVGVTIATGAYVLPRLQKPVTASRLTKAWEWLKGCKKWVGL